MNSLEYLLLRHLLTVWRDSLTPRRCRPAAWPAYYKTCRCHAVVIQGRHTEGYEGGLEIKIGGQFSTSIHIDIVLFFFIFGWHKPTVKDWAWYTYRWVVTVTYWALPTAPRRFRAIMPAVLRAIHVKLFIRSSNQATHSPIPIFYTGILVTFARREVVEVPGCHEAG